MEIKNGFYISGFGDSCITSDQQNTHNKFSREMTLSRVPELEHTEQSIRQLHKYEAQTTSPRLANSE